ncbi:MAG: hypothetical protein Q8M31_04050 [Beijerinckiaceae bacterium]|nr:hypothetical protein [Beijerinckiaceae bacterium]
MRLHDLAGNLAVPFSKSASKMADTLRVIAEQRAEFRQVGSGPGSAIEADPSKAGFLMIALALDPVRREIVRKTMLTASLTATGGSCCLTGASDFGSALFSILADEDIACRVDSVSLSDNRASIAFDGSQESVFGAGPAVRTRVSRTVVLDGLLLQGVAQWLKR